jgi:hypothetical protein
MFYTFLTISLLDALGMIEPLKLFPIGSQSATLEAPSQGGKREIPFPVDRLLAPKFLYTPAETDSYLAKLLANANAPDRYWACPAV